MFTGWPRIDWHLTVAEQVEWSASKPAANPDYSWRTSYVRQNVVNRFELQPRSGERSYTVLRGLPLENAKCAKED